MSHHCHAISCRVRVPPEYLMCIRHWNMVPRHTKSLVWSTYRNGQCSDMDPSENYVVAASEAVISVARQEGKWTHSMSRTTDLSIYLLICAGRYLP